MKFPRRSSAPPSLTAVLKQVLVYVLVLTREFCCKLSDVLALEARNIQFIL